ncbi:MAG: hypothetical protein AAF222_11215 [Pseudomonadota bacterium]
MFFPLTVCWLAFRRLALSKSDNAWIYAGVCLLSAVIAAAALPWMLGLTSISWPIIMLALLSPALWIAAILVCDVSRERRYGHDPLFQTARTIGQKSVTKLSPLLLGPSDRMPEEEPVFRHRNKPVRTKAPKPSRSKATRALLSLTRDIRDNATSERRRRKLLPPPEPAQLPFLQSSQDS